MTTLDDGHPPSPLVEGPYRFKIIETEGDIFADAPDGAVLIHAVNCLGQWGSGIAKAFKTKYPAAFQVYKAHCTEASRSKDRSRLLPGTCLLIPPQADDYRPPSPSPAAVPDDEEESGARPTRKRRKVTAEVKKKKKHWIACLFTSYGYGKHTKAKPGKDPPGTILGNTEEALRGLRAQVEVVDAGTERIGKNTGRRSGAVRARDDKDSEVGDDGGADEDKTDRRTREEGRVADVPGPLYACKFNSGSFGVEWRDTQELIERAFDGSVVRVMHVVSPPPPPTGK